MTSNATSGIDRETAELLVRITARALGNAGLAHAYGHCSQRLDEESFLVCAPRPMGLIKAGETGTVVPVRGALPPGVLGEVSIHQHIYATRPGIGGVCRSMPPNIMALSTLGRTPKVRHGMGTYFSPGMPLWDDPQLVRSDERASQVVETMDDNAAVVMRGNGIVTAGTDVTEALVLTWYAEDAARIELLVAATGEQGMLISTDEASRRAIRTGHIFERMWDYLTVDDPELESLNARRATIEGKKT